MIIRLSEKLAKKVHAGKLTKMPLDGNPYADWSCHLFKADRTQCVIVSNTSSLYSCVTYGKGLTNDGLLIERALSVLRDFMEDDGQAFVYQKFIAPSSATVSFAKALTRSVMRSFIDLINHAKAWLEQEEISPHDVGFKLNDVLLSALGTDSKPYGTPKEAFKLLASEVN